MEPVVLTVGTYLIIGGAVWVWALLLLYEYINPPRYALPLAKGWAFAWPLVVAWGVRDIIRDAEERLEGASDE